MDTILYYVLTAVESHTEYNGGSVRVQPTTSVNPANCPNMVVYDFLYMSGTQELRLATVSLIYL